jgi:hypothetical protein
MQRLPADRLLLAQHAVLLAHAGDTEAAHQILTRLGRGATDDDPVLAYARHALRASQLDRQRDARTPRQTDAWVESAVEASVEAIDVDESASGAAPRDPLMAAVQRLGSRIATMSRAEIVDDARTLLRALSAGGALASTGRSELSHAARGLLAVIIDTVQADGAHTEVVQGSVASSAWPPPRTTGLTYSVATLVQHIVRSVCTGDTDDAVRSLRRQPAIARDAVGVLLQALLRGALQPSSAGATSAPRAPQDAAERAASNRAGEDAATSGRAGAVHEWAEERGPVVPVRLGLRLIDESALSRSKARESGDGGGASVSMFGARGLDGAPMAMSQPQAEDAVNWAVVPTAVQGAMPAPRNAADRGRAGGRDRHASGESPAVPSDGGGPRLLAVLCVLVAAAAAALGYGAVAMAFGVGASWLALRRAGAHSSSGGPPERDGRDQRH